MRLQRLHAAAVMLSLLVAASARADTVTLKDGRVLRNVHATVQGDELVVTRELGSTSFALAEVASVTTETGWRDEEELERRKLQAGLDPVQLAGLAVWCTEHGFETEARELRTTAQGIALDHRLDEIASRADADARARGYLRLAEDMQRGHFPEAERQTVLSRALEAAPEDRGVRLALGQVERNGSWVTPAEAHEMDARAEEEAMSARGLVKYDGRWITAQALASIEQAAAAREELAARVAACDAARAEAERCRATRERRRDTFFIPVMPSYRRRHR
jgi:hypothetical protein